MCFITTVSLSLVLCNRKWKIWCNNVKPSSLKHLLLHLTLLIIVTTWSRLPWSHLLLYFILFSRILEVRLRLSFVNIMVQVPRDCRAWICSSTLLFKSRSGRDGTWLPSLRFFALFVAHSTATASPTTRASMVTPDTIRSCVYSCSFARHWASYATWLRFSSLQLNYK